MSLNDEVYLTLPQEAITSARVMRGYAAGRVNIFRVRRPMNPVAIVLEGSFSNRSAVNISLSERKTSWTIPRGRVFVLSQSTPGRGLVSS